MSFNEIDFDKIRLKWNNLDKDRSIMIFTEIVNICTALKKYEYYSSITIICSVIKIYMNLSWIFLKLEFNFVILLFRIKEFFIRILRFFDEEKFNNILSKRSYDVGNDLLSDNYTVIDKEENFYGLELFCNEDGFIKILGNSRSEREMEENDFNEIYALGLWGEFTMKKDFKIKKKFCNKLKELNDFDQSQKEIIIKCFNNLSESDRFCLINKKSLFKEMKIKNIRLDAKRENKLDIEDYYFWFEEKENKNIIIVITHKMVVDVGFKLKMYSSIWCVGVLKRIFLFENLNEKPMDIYKILKNILNGEIYTYYQNNKNLIHKLKREEILYVLKCHISNANDNIILNTYVLNFNSFIPEFLKNVYCGFKNFNTNNKRIGSIY
jgi:hypothetical protein